MERDQERNFEILSAIDESDQLTQRALALKGYIKVTEFPRKPAARKRLRYLLTPKGLAEKTRLATEYMGRSLRVYRQTRETLREALAHLGQDGHKRVALYGTGEAAEIAYLTLREFGLEPVGVFDRMPPESFLGMPVRDIRELAVEEVDRIIVATFDRPKVHVPVLVGLGIPAERLVLLHPPARRTNDTR